MTADTAAPVSSRVPRRRQVTRTARITAAGQTFIHVAKASRAEATTGRLASRSRAMITSGAVSPSIRPTATGPSRPVTTSHQYDAAYRAGVPGLLITATAAPFRAVKRRNQTSWYGPQPSTAARTMGMRAPMG
ncbi:hypothetical protein OL239_07670 [Arthrobacter sp. ATA002]|nr:hypothetical protein [Arthrobacter sp. ATA002]WAP52983.1 hypothetical protein OL239_07670 [Arthrobacter sp. ATA002]